jgi:uncharacterized repeat protein (TIGR01451 family)
MNTEKWYVDRRIRLLLLIGGLFAALLFLTAWVLPLADNADATFLGEAIIDNAGSPLATAGDVNGDGYDDFLISAYLNNEHATDAGKVYLILGHQDAGWGQDVRLENADASFVGQTIYDNAGRDVAGAGDVNGDGYDDFLIGAYLHDASEILTSTGKVYLILGDPQANWGQGFDLANADASFVGEAAEDYAGYALASAGDVNGDGYEDFIVGAYGVDLQGDDRAGKAYLILGRQDALWGQSMSLADADASFVGEAVYDRAGHDLAVVGDVNGDGYDDFLISAYTNSEGGTYAGKAYLILGRAIADWGQDFSLADADASFVGEAVYDYAGHAVTGAGDVNGDGLEDFVIGAYQNDDGALDGGKAYLFLGRTAADWGRGFDLANADASFLGAHAGDYTGSALSGAGDVNGDGYDDFLIGAYRFDATEVLTDSGRAYLVSGRPSDDWRMDTDLADADTAIDIWAFDGEVEDDEAGTALAGGGDVNGDGFGDFLVGAPRNDEAADNAGKVYLTLGKGLVLQKTASADVVTSGEPITYTMHYTNTNVWDVQQVRIGDRIPDNTTYTGCSGGLNCVRQGERVFWYLGTVAPQAAGTVQMDVQVPSDVLDGTVITNTAWITAPTRVNVVFSRVTTLVEAGGFRVYLPLVLKAYAPEIELAYDDGAIDTNTSWETGKGFAVRFTPPVGQAQLMRARYYFLDPRPIEVHVWDENRTDLIPPFTADTDQDGWNDVHLSAYNVTVSGDFYLGFIHLEDYRPTLGVDTTSADDRSFEVDGEYWEQQTSDYMIRAVVVGQ